MKIIKEEYQMNDELYNERLEEIQQLILNQINPKISKNGLQIIPYGEDRPSRMFQVVFRRDFNYYLDTKNHPVNLSEKFFELLESVIPYKIIYNNTRSLFWFSELELRDIETK